MVPVHRRGIDRGNSESACLRSSALARYERSGVGIRLPLRRHSPGGHLHTMKMPCGGCGQFKTSGTYSPEVGCFYCWSAACSSKYADYWDEGQKVRDAASPEPRPERSYEPTTNPYKRDHVFTFSAPVPVSPPNQIEPVPTPRTVPLTCVHRGEENGEVLCPTCNGKVMVKTFACTVFGSCTLVKRVDMLACCDRGRCPSYQTSPA